VSNLILIECKPDVYQSIKADKDMFVVALRPHLYIHGSPTGTIKVQVQDAGGKVVAESASQTITDLKTLAYAHKYALFYINANLVEDSFYRLAVVCGGGYAFSEAAYVGVCLDWDNPKTETTYSPGSGYSAALDFEIWERVTT
jgi:hypothetical protein